MNNDTERLLHRDDLDMEIAEQVVKAVREKHPGGRVVFAGDEPGATADAEYVARERIRAARFAARQCFQCGRTMPEPNAGKRVAKGWAYWESLGPGSDCFACPECDAGLDCRAPVAPLPETA